MSPFDINLCAAKWKALTVNEQGDMAAEELLDACDSIISIFDAMGSGLAIVKSDMSGNVAHMRRNVATFGPGVSLQVMVQKDVEDKVTDKDGTTAMSLLWLTRYAPLRWTAAAPQARRFEGAHNGSPCTRALLASSGGAAGPCTSSTSSSRSC